jgi:acyl-CoA thioesterase
MEGQKTGFNELLGIHFCGGEKGEYKLELTVGPKHCHQAGLVHGGVYLSLLDTVMSRAIRTLLGGAGYAPTMALNTSFFRPMKVGIISAEGKVVNQSRRTAFVEGSLFDDEGRMLAKGSASFFLL